MKNRLISIVQVSKTEMNLIQNKRYICVLFIEELKAVFYNINFEKVSEVFYETLYDFFAQATTVITYGYCNTDNSEQILFQKIRDGVGK